MRNDFRTVIPSRLEISSMVLLTLLLLLLSNTKEFLQRYGLISSSEVIRTKLSRGVDIGLTKLDSFPVTRSIVTFGIWAVVGLISFSFIQAIAQTTGQIKYREEVSSDEYVHPANFSRGAFWRHLIVNAVVSFGLLASLIVCSVLYLLFVVPAGITYARHFLLQISFGHVIDLLLGIFTVFVGTYIVYFLMKAVAWHHRADKA